MEGREDASECMRASVCRACELVSGWVRDDTCIVYAVVSELLSEHWD